MFTCPDDGPAAVVTTERAGKQPMKNAFRQLKLHQPVRSRPSPAEDQSPKGDFARVAAISIAGQSTYKSPDDRLDSINRKGGSDLPPPCAPA